MYKFPKSNLKFASIIVLSSILILGLPLNPKAESKEEISRQSVQSVPTASGIQTQLDTVNEAIPPQPQTPSTNTAYNQATQTPKIKGLALTINAIGLNIPLGQTTLDKQGHLMVPANPNQAAWYKLGPKIGAAGTALITGHLDSAAGPAIFYNLRKLKAGNEIKVTQPDGLVSVFRVDKLASYRQDNTFPWSEVYRTLGPSAIRIITCDGVYNPKTGAYSRNLVVYASLVGSE